MFSFSGAQEFLDHLLNCYFADLEVRQTENFDWPCLRGDENQTYPQLHKETILAITRKCDDLFRAYSLLADNESRQLYLDLLRYRLSGHKHVKLPTNNERYWSCIRAAASHPCEKGTAICDDVRLNHYDAFHFEGKSLTMDILTLAWPFLLRQYYFDRGGVRICPEKGDHVIDAGGCFGDTALAFGASVGPGGAVYLFELLDLHLHICRQNIAQNRGLAQFTLFDKGLSNVVREAACQTVVQDGFDLGFKLDENDNRFTTTTLDHLTLKGEIDRVDFIKMDIEGSELRALKGAEETIRRFKPKLAISLYHKIEDFYEIPLYLDSLGLGYRFYIDHYTIHVSETVLYVAV